MGSTLDLFKDFTPEELKAFIELYSKTGRAKAVSEGVRRYWDNLSPEEYNRRCKINSERWTDEERDKASGRSEKQWAGYSDGRRKEVLDKVFLNEKYRKAFAEARGNMTPEETEVWINRSFHNPKAKKLAIEGMRIGLTKWWASLSEERKNKEILKRVSASAKANAVGPNWSEIFVGMYLEEHFPGKWAYNGSGEQGICIGGRVPDFININGRKEVIEVFGSYWHPDSDVEDRMVHYKKYGFDCRVIWEYECTPEDIGRILEGY